MGENYKVAMTVVLSTMLIFGGTTLLLVQSDKIEKDKDALNVIIAAPSEVLKLTITGIFGFISGSVTQANKKNDEVEKRLDDLEKRNQELEKENNQLREINNI